MKPALPLTRTTHSLCALVAFAALLIFFTALLGACSHPALPGPKIDPALYGMIPPDTVLLAGARLANLVNSALDGSQPVSSRSLR